MIFLNSGTVIGESEGVQIDGGRVAQIINSGDIFGSVEMGSGNGLHDGRFGRVTGSVFGEKGADILPGGRGADEFDGGADADLIFGGSGGDRFVYDDATAGARADVVHDFVSGVDKFDLVDLVAGEPDFNGTGAFSGGGDASVRYFTTNFGSIVQIMPTAMAPSTCKST